MKIFKISQTVHKGYDTYDSAIVCAEDEESAKRIHPNHYYVIDTDGQTYFNYTDGTREKKITGEWNDTGWTLDIKDIVVEYLGEAKEGLPKGVICSSFNAG